MQVVLLHCDQVQRSGVDISHKIGVILIDLLRKRVKIAIRIEIHILLFGIVARIVDEILPDLRLIARIRLCIGNCNIEPIVIRRHCPCDNKIDYKGNKAYNADDPQLVIIPYILKLRGPLELRNFPLSILEFLLKILLY